MIRKENKQDKLIFILVHFNRVMFSSPVNILKGFTNV